jgi:hypothetical protein
LRRLRASSKERALCYPGGDEMASNTLRERGDLLNSLSLKLGEDYVDTPQRLGMVTALLRLS